MANALIVIAQGIEEMETVIIADILVRAGVNITLASVTGRQIEASRGVKIVADVDLNQVKDQSFDMIICPGGLPGAEYLRDSELLKILLMQQDKQHKWIASICASPALVLAHHGLLQARQATCYPGCEEKLPLYVDETVVVDGHIVTSQGPGTAMAFALKLVQLLVGEVQAKEVAATALIKI
ncbi:MAG: DJ-1 family glyoxalase III [Bermanella sp.]